MTRQNEDQWTMTYSGVRFNLENPKEEDVRIEDIAHSLARVNRFNGHHKFQNYSVAQHSVYVSSLCDYYPLAGLLHDASEAYIQDVISPLKFLLREVYLPLEEKLMRVIFSKFKIDYDDIDMWDEVKDADQVVFALELRDVKATDERKFYNLSMDIPVNYSLKIKKGNSPDKAEELFLDFFGELYE